MSHYIQNNSSKDMAWCDVVPTNERSTNITLMALAFFVSTYM